MTSPAPAGYQNAPRVGSLRGVVHFALCISLGTLLVAGCATKSPSGATNQTESGNPQQARAKRPFITTVFSWFGAVPNLFPRKAKPPQAQVPRFVGTIKTVVAEDRFVLIDATAFQAVNTGDLLVCIRDQKETANLRMSALKNPPFLIADITSGSPAAGDRVFKP